VRITGPHGRTLYGSPLQPRAFEEAARTAVLTVARHFPLYRDTGKYAAPSPLVELPAPMAAAAPPRRKASAKRMPAHSRRVDIVIPAYRGKDTILACLASVFAHRGAGERVIVVADGSPDQDLVAALSALADQAEIVLHVETVNRGFPIAANIGLRLAAGNDAVLLNSDTIVTPGWLAGLRAAIHSASDIGTATPLSNDATIFSYPRRDGPNPCPDAASAADLARKAAAANHRNIVEVPTGHAFCLYIRAECLQETGVLREDLFAQGYGEENDFCMRARHLGWRHVAVPGVFVAHHGGGSFNAARDDLMHRNLAILNQLHIGYSDTIARWHREDPLGESRRRIDLARLQSRALGREAVLLVTHDRDGGVRRHVAERLEVIAESGRRPLLLRPEPCAEGETAAYAARVEAEFENEYPNLVFRMPDEHDSLLSCLQGCRVREIEVHSLIGHGDGVIDLLFGLAAPLHLIIHDYSWLCPRISLTSGDHRYCGEPGIASCRDCIADHGAAFEPASPDAVVARTHRLIDRAQSVIAPSNDAARRIERHFRREVVVAHWEEPRGFTLRPVREEAGRSRPVRVCVVGAISYEKGYNNLLQCARLAAAEKLPVEFVVVGHTCDDRRLLETGVVRITGRYDQAEAVALIEAQQADIAWLPSIWPETWCYVLTEIWQAGLRVVVYDIGAQAERVRATGGGVVVPLDATGAAALALFLGRVVRPLNPKREGRSGKADRFAYRIAAVGL
jgi:GT2 family glycosyltransferase